LASFWNQTVVYDKVFAAFGEDYNDVNDSQNWDWVFAGMTANIAAGSTQDSVALYDATYREYAPGQGRWISPDPAGLAAVDPTNPQSWNRYAYVTNNPLLFTDPSGLAPPSGCQPAPAGSNMGSGGPTGCDPGEGFGNTPFQPGCNFSIDFGGVLPCSLMLGIGGLGSGDSTAICPQHVSNCQYFNGPGGVGILVGNCLAGDCGLYAMVNFVDSSAANNGSLATPPPAAGSPTSLIRNDYKRYQSCVQEGALAAGAKGAADFAINGAPGAPGSSGQAPTPLETAHDAQASQMNAMAELMGDCLKQFPLAPLNPAYQGPLPSLVF
jgi:RHS repeat-associated protein